MQENPAKRHIQMTVPSKHLLVPSQQQKTLEKGMKYVQS